MLKTDLLLQQKEPPLKIHKKFENFYKVDYLSTIFKRIVSRYGKILSKETVNKDYITLKERTQELYVLEQLFEAVDHLLHKLKHS